MSRRGSTLLLVVMLLAIISVLLWTLDRAISSEIRMKYGQIPQWQANIAADSMSTAYLYYLKSGETAGSIPGIDRLKKYLECPVRVRKELVVRDDLPPTFRFQFRADCVINMKARNTAGFIYFRQNYTDYLLSSSSDMILAGIPQQSRFFIGPVFAGGNLILRDGGHQFFVRPSWQTTAILAMKKIFFFDQWKDYREKLKETVKQTGSMTVEEKKMADKEKELLAKVSRLIEPIYVGTADFKIRTDSPLKKVTSRLFLNEEWEKIQKGGESPLIKTGLPEATRLSPPAFGPMFTYARQRVDEDFYFRNISGNNGGAIRFPNGHLIEKRLIGIGNGLNLSFNLPSGNSPVYRVFLKDIDRILTEGPAPEFTKLDPVKDLEGMLDRDFTINKRVLTFKKPSEKIMLNLPEDAFDTVGEIRVRGPSGSSFSAARDINKIYFEYLGNARELTDQDFRMEESRGVMRIMNPELFGHLWVSIGTTDGVKRTYHAAVNIAEVIYLNGKRTEAKAVPGAVVFSKTPPPGLEIQIMILRPRIFVEKLAPAYHTGVYIDRDVEAVTLDLSRLFPSPSYGLILSEVPLYIFGTPSRRLTIMSTQDVYIGDINEGEEDGHFVLVATPGMIWAQREKKSLEIRRVIALSGGDGIYINTSNDPYFYERRNTEKSIFTGSVYFSGEARNLYYYPDMATGDAYYYHPGRQADFNFFYEQDLQKSELMPYLMPESIRIISRVR